MSHLLTIAGPAVAECSYFHKEPPNTIVEVKKFYFLSNYNIKYMIYQFAIFDLSKVIPEHRIDQKYPENLTEPRRPVQPTARGTLTKSVDFTNFRVENKNSKGPSKECG